MPYVSKEIFAAQAKTKKTIREGLAKFPSPKTKYEKQIVNTMRRAEKSIRDYENELKALFIKWLI